MEYLLEIYSPGYERQQSELCGRKKDITDEIDFGSRPTTSWFAWKLFKQEM